MLVSARVLCLKMGNYRSAGLYDLASLRGTADHTLAEPALGGKWSAAS